MKIRAISTIAVLLSAVYVAPAMAFGLPSIPGVGGSATAGSSVNVDALMQQQTDLLVTVTTSLRNLSAAQVMMAKALKLDSAAAAAQSTADSLATGNLAGKDDMQKALESTVDVQKKIEEAIARGDALSSDGKAIFTKSLVPYGVGSAGMVASARKAADAGQSLTHTMDPTVLLKLGSLIYVAKEAPTLISTFGGATKDIISYAGPQGIDTSALKNAGASLGN
jgi:hypothetical protein